jgi:hypothetical protein
MFASPVQSDVRWSSSANYIGKASNTLRLACKAASADDWLVGTHGDDFIGYCPKCGIFHSGDWSNFDLHVSARVILACRQAWFDVIKSMLTPREIKLFYALAYFAIRSPCIWMWNRKGEQRMSIRKTLGFTKNKL